MKSRCYNPNCPTYKWYGARGVKVCDRWRYSFENFYADVGDPPEGKSFDRWPDINGNYKPGNWRWADRHQQRKNSRPISCEPRKQRWFYGHGPNGEMIIENNQSHVARIFGLEPNSISACLRGKIKTHRKWIFKFI